MTRPTFNSEISWGHISIGLTMLVTVISLYYGLSSQIANEAYARELGDSSLQQQAAENTAAIERNIDAIKDISVWADKHKQEWSRHLGEYGAEHD